MNLNDNNPYDPIEVAKKQGQILGMGLAGSYSGRPVVRFGFILIGSLLFLQGLSCFIAAVLLILGGQVNDEMSLYFFIGSSLFGVGGLFLGGMMLWRSLKK